jgi:UDP-N-acetylmuramyl pentapeptide phosphotransferase/UDP-N-acetylglucosamine-1-phosphate transferase
MSHTYVFLLLIACFLFAFGITCIYRIWAMRHSILDIPNARSSHQVATPKGGGISIVLAFYTGLLLYYLNGQIENDLFFALLPGLAIALVGFIDGLKELSPAVRFIAQAACSAIALYFLGGFESLFGTDWKNVWSVIALFGMVWFINLFNFLDGSDGYASMEAISVAVFLWYFTKMDLLLILAFSTGGFLYWNWPKARIFMGDVGSTTLGFILVVFGIYFHNQGTVSFTIWILITALFWFDATVTLIRRALNKEKLSQAHKKHIYQRAIQGGFSHLKIMLTGLGINVVLFAICFMIHKKYCPYLPGFLMVLIILWFAMKCVDRKFSFKKLADSL